MDNVVPFPGLTRLDIDIERVLDAAKTALDGGIVIGWDHDGTLYFASSYTDGKKILWLLKMAELKLLDAVK